MKTRRGAERLNGRVGPEIDIREAGADESADHPDESSETFTSVAEVGYRRERDAVPVEDAHHELTPEDEEAD